MAETRMNNNKHTSHHHHHHHQQQQPSRLQKRRPASLQISPASSSNWNAVIPLLSPLCASPPPPIDRTAEIRSTNPVGPASVESQKPLVYNKWQHPAAPFFYEPAGSFPNSFFVPV